MLVGNKIATFTNEKDTGLHRCAIGFLINVNNWMGTGDKLLQLNNLNGVTRYTTLAQGLLNGNIVEISGSGGSSIAVYDEGILINNNICEINFIGADVLSNQDPTNPCRVNVYIPTPTFPSHYNTVDGTTNGIVSDVWSANRYVSNPVGVTNHGFDNTWTSTVTLRPCTNVGSLTFGTPQAVLFEDLLSNIEVDILGADGVTPIATHHLGPIVGNTSALLNNISINVVGFGASGSKYQGLISVTVNIANILPNSGKFTVRIVHNNGVNYTKTQTLFYDDEPNAAILSGVSTAPHTPVYKYLSGVAYYTTGSLFTVSITDIDNLNGTTYPSTQVIIQGSYGTRNLTGSQLTSWVNTWDDDNDSYSANNFSIATANGCDSFLNVVANTIDWSWGTGVSFNLNALWNTYGSVSDELNEFFTDEDFRLESDFTTQWDSTEDLRTYDNLNGAQQICGVLKIPSRASTSNDFITDFSTYLPAGNPDYSAFDGDEYFRRFTDVTNLVRGSAQLAITGFTLTQLINSEVEIWINIPGRFISPCYAHGAAEFNFGTFTGDDDPIRVNSSTAGNIVISFGNLGLDSTHNFFEMRLVINNNTIEPSSIQVSW